MSYGAIGIKGIKEVEAALYSYSQQLGDRVVLRALRLGANFMKTAVSAVAPSKTGRLRRGFRVYRSKIHSGKTSTDAIGVYLTLKRGKDSPYYGQFQEHGWNVRGKSKAGSGRREFKQALVAAGLNRRNGRSTLPGKRNIPGLFFIGNTFAAKQQQAENLIIAATEAGAEILSRKVGLTNG